MDKKKNRNRATFPLIILCAFELEIARLQQKKKIEKKRKTSTSFLYSYMLYSVSVNSTNH